jgi:hypothetical protein
MNRFSRTFVLIFVTLALASIRLSFAQDKARTEVIQAQAMGQGTQMGRTFNVTVNIKQYSTPEERQVLTDAFSKAGSEGLYNALTKMPSKGHMAITGTIGYDISYVRRIENKDGITLRVLTNRPINFGEAWYSGRSLDYNLSALELNLADQSDKRTGTLLPACQFKIDKKTGELVVENLQNPWKLVNIQDRTNE